MGQRTIGGGGMRKLNEQWIEVIDGQEHMYKAVLPSLCYCCEYNIYKEVGQVKCQNGEQCVTQQGHVKDLGILRLRDGVLPCPFCGEYPEVSYTDEYVEISCENMECKIASMTLEDKRLQQAIDAWNRRL